MITYQLLCDCVQKVIKKTGESDPARICEQMDIPVLYRPMGTRNGAIKGFSLELKRIRTITINSDMPDTLQRIILSHELGHAVLHRNCQPQPNFGLSHYNQNSIMENEANLFAAELLLPDEDVLETLSCGYDFFEAAGTLHVPYELLDFKCRIMKWKGYNIEPPVAVGSNFLCKMQIPCVNDLF